MKTPKGKGIYIWLVKELLKIYGSFDGIAQAAGVLGFSHVELKVTQSYYRYNLRRVGERWINDLVPPLVEAFHKKGIEVWGWGYVYPYSLDRTADTIASQVKELDLDGFIFNAEPEFKGRATQADYLAGKVRNLLPDTPLGLSSYRFPEYHPPFPFAQFMRYCDFHNQQVYWAGKTNPAEQLRESIKQLKPYADKPFVPIGAALQEYVWPLTPALVQDFIDGTQSNFGWVMQSSSDIDTFGSYRSSDYATAGERPKFVVVYTIPGPKTFIQPGLIGLGKGL